VRPNEVAPSILFHSGDHWRLDGNIVLGPDLEQLRPGLLYQVGHHDVGAGCGVVLTGDVPSTSRVPVQH
jgi:hypothetical protein